MSIQRRYTAKESKSWSSKNIDIEKTINEIRKNNERIADSLLLQLHFGLRARESLLLKPHLADKKTFLFIEKIDHTTKSHRARTVPITTEAQRKLLKHLKSYLHVDESLVPEDENFYKFRCHYYNVLRKHGISQKNGVIAHGLRCEYIENLYHEATGHAPKVKGGELYKTDKELDKLGRLIVAQHRRESIHLSWRQVIKTLKTSR